MDLRILGPLEIWEGTEQIRVDAPRQRALLALLAIHAGEVLSTDRIVDELWGDSPPSSPRSTLRFHVSKLRAVLGDAALEVVTCSPGYVLEIDAEEIDSHRFEQMAVEGRRLIAEDPERAARVLMGALALWRGTALADFTYEEFAQGEITRLEELRLATLEDRIDADLVAGHHHDLVGELEPLVANHPLRERLWGQLMTALYRTGRQAEALGVYQKARGVFGEIGIEPSRELQAIEEKVLLQDPLLLTPRPPARRHNLPERVSSFVGRCREIETIGKQLKEHRLVTLTGVGGVGKTSLAIEASRRLTDRYPDGIWVLATGDIGDPHLIPERVAHVLGVQIQSAAGLVDQLGDHLSGREVLLVFDGCERQVDAVARIVESLLSTAPRLRVLATSREPLEVGGERRLEVPVLDTVGSDADAVRLFVDRAGLVQPGFETTTGNIDLVSEICRRVAGIPLAVELAAARLGALTLDQICMRLDDLVTLLAQSHSGEAPHRSVRAVLDWSHELLNPSEQILFRRLSVFRGGATMEAVEQVCADETLPAASVLDPLARLVDVSLVGRDREADRFEMLDPVRQYAACHLERAEEADQLSGRHALYYRELAGKAFDGAYGPDEVEWARICVHEEPNEIAAISWALDSGDPMLAVATGAYLSPFWVAAGRVATQDRFLGPLLEEGRKHPSRELVILLVHAAYVGSPSESLSLADEAVAVASGLDDEFAAGLALMRMGSVVGWGDDFEEGVAQTWRAFELLDLIEHPKALDCLFNIAGMLVRVEDKTGRRLDEAEEAARELLARAESLPSAVHEGIAHLVLGWAAMERGDLDLSRERMLKALQLHATVRADRWIAWETRSLVEIEIAAGNVERAVTYHERYGALFREIWGGAYLPMDGLVQIAVGDLESGITTLVDALDTYASASTEMISALTALADACTTRGDSVAASRFFGATQGIRVRKKLALTAHELRTTEDAGARLRTDLGSGRFEQEWARGVAMTAEEVALYARDALRSGPGG